MRWVFEDKGMEQFELSIPGSSNTCVAIISIADYSDKLLGSEVVKAALMKPLRKNAFSSGRHAVHLAQNELGLEPSEIPAAGRKPIWPIGQVGSITHSTDFAAAIVSRDLLSVGVDIERLGRIKQKLHNKFFTSTEISSISQMTEGGADSIIFSAKESIYKAIYSIVERYVNFQEVELILSPKNSTFSVSYMGENMSSLRNYETCGYGSVFKGHVLTVVEIR